MSRSDDVATFLAGRVFAVVGASNDRSKFGNRVLRAYLAHGREVVPVNPKERLVEGLPAVADLASLGRAVDGVSIITPPHVTARVVDEALRLGLERLWLQPGAEDRAAVDRARAAGALVLAYGPCVLVELDGAGGR
jgi:predicted CoA-binding protein